MRGLSLKLAGFLSALGFLVLLLPFAFLPLNTPWASFHFTSGDLGAVRVSLVYSGLALLLILVFGTPLAYILARRRFRFNVLVDILVLLPLLTPPLAMGILLASLYGPYGFLGGPLSRLGLPTYKHSSSLCSSPGLRCGTLLSVGSTGGLRGGTARARGGGAHLG